MILVDVHPCAVQTPSGDVHQRARAVLTHRRLRVWVARGREQVLVLDEPHDGVHLETRHPLVGRPVDVVTAAGQVVLTRTRGCDCGSVLKALQPPRDDAV